MIRVGVIGLGFMGGVHLRHFQALENVEVVAVCDAKPVDGQAKQGNIDAGAGELNLEGVAVFADVAEMLEKEPLDAVSVALPTHLHKAVSIQCLEAGVHVLCEKPMALSVEDCDAMIAAADKAGKQLMVAHCIRFWPEYVFAKQAVAGGEYGKVLAADFSRLSFLPAWDNGSWLADETKSGGIALDLHIHDLDFIQYLFGTPNEECSTVSRLENGSPGHVLTVLDYGGDCVVSATASWMMPKSFGFSMGFRIVFEKAALVFENGQLTVFPNEGEPVVPELAGGDGYSGEIGYFVRLVEGQVKQAIITPEDARESVRMALETVKA